MSRLTYFLSFYCRSSKASKNGLAPIELSLIINGKRCFIQLPRKEYPSVFKKSIQSKRTNPVKEYIEEVRNQFNSIQLDMMRNNIPLSADSLKSYYKTGGIKKFTIEDALNEYLELLQKRIDVDLEICSYHKYVAAINCFKKFTDTTQELSALTPALIKSFLIDCNSKYQPSTVSGIMTKIKTIVMYQKDCGRIQINPFANIKYSKGTKEIEYLTEEEIDKLYNLEIENKSLSDVRDAFILQASTGLAYIDVYNLKKEDIQIDEAGTHYIVKNRCKTNTQYVTVVLDKGVEVLKKHNYQLHIISNQKYNYYLKNIQGLAGISTKLTTHLARRSFATHLLNSGVRLETVAKTLGHKSTAISSKYYCQVQAKEVVKEVKAVI